MSNHRRPYPHPARPGDLSYATVSPPNGVELGFAWDSWVTQNEPFASNIPFMMTVGNHESTPGTKTNASGTFPQEYASFTSRFRMPHNGNPSEPNFYFSYSMGPAFFISVDGENDFSVGSAQHTWLDATLAAVDRAVYPWVFAVMHHPILSSDSNEVPDHTPGGPRSTALEPLLLKYAVDVVFQVGDRREGRVWGGGGGVDCSWAGRARASLLPPARRRPPLLHPPPQTCDSAGPPTQL